MIWLLYVHVFNTVHFLYGVIFNICKLWDLYTSPYKIACLCIVVEGYLWHYVGMVVYYLSPFLCLCYKFVCDVTLNSAILSDLIILWADLTPFSIYIYIWFIIVIYKSVQMAILTLLNFLHIGRCFFLLDLYWG